MWNNSHLSMQLLSWLMVVAGKAREMNTYAPLIAPWNLMLTTGRSLDSVLGDEFNIKDVESIAKFMFNWRRCR